MNDFKEFYRTFIEKDFHYGTGSWSVINPQIKTILNQYGEYYPNVDDISNFQITENDFNKIKKVTLLSDESPNEDEISKKLYSDNPNIKYDNRMGYYLNAYAGHVVEGEFRSKATSGGFGTWIFKELLEKKLIDAVIHVKESKNNDAKVLFEYGISNSVEEILSGSKTKYYPVEFSKAMKFVKENPGRYAFIGIPNFVMSLRLLQEIDPILKERIIFSIGLIASHQKSTKYTEAIAWQCGIKPGDLESINYRKKADEIPPNYYVAELVGKIDGQKTVVTKDMRELIGMDWGQGFFKMQASNYTDDVMNETADVTLGDAWLPEYIQDRKGNNIILTRNPIIDKIISEGKKANKISITEIDIAAIYKSQEAHYRHNRTELPYRLYKRKKAGNWYPKKRVDINKNIPYLRIKIQDLREEISGKSHEVYRDAVIKNDLNVYLEGMDKLVKKYNKTYRIMHYVDKGKRTLKKYKLYRS